LIFFLTRNLSYGARTFKIKSSKQYTLFVTESFIFLRDINLGACSVKCHDGEIIHPTEISADAQKQFIIADLRRELRSLYKISRRNLLIKFLISYPYYWINTNFNTSPIFHKERAATEEFISRVTFYIVLLL
jgi:hypothetical protein